MSIVTIILAGRKFKLSCSNESQQYVEKLAEKLGLLLAKMAKENKSASFEMLLVMISLGLMDEKYSKTEISSENALTKVEIDHQEQLASIFNSLTNIASKFDDATV